MCVDPHSTWSTTSSEAELTEQETILPSIFENLDCYPNRHRQPRQTKAKTLSFLYSKDAFGFQAPDLWWMGISHPQFENTFPPGLRPTIWNFLAVDSLTSSWKCFISSSKPHTAASDRCFTKYHLFDKISPKLKVWCRLWDHQKCFGWSFSPGSCHRGYQGVNLREQNMVGFHHLDGSGSSLNQNPEEPGRPELEGPWELCFRPTVTLACGPYTQGFETEGQRDRLPQGHSWIATKASLITTPLRFWCSWMHPHSGQQIAAHMPLYSPFTVPVGILSQNPS